MAAKHKKVLYERCNGVNRQPSSGQNFNCQSLNSGEISPSAVKKTVLLLLAIKQLQGLSSRRRINLYHCYMA